VRDKLVTKRDSSQVGEAMKKPVQKTAGLAINFAELLERVENDHELLLDLFTIFKREFPPRLYSLREAITHAEMKQVETSSHTLKGMFSNLAMTRAAAAAAHLEQMGRNGERARLEDALAHLEQELASLLPELDTYLAEARR
jgi:HPt (histidine-containing phosphotransfer) domain-containing protein